MIVYTIIFGDYDTLKDPLRPDKGVKYIVYSDTPKESKVWEWIPTDLKSVKDQRKLKILGYQDFDDDLSVYMDASILSKSSIEIFASNYLEDMTVLQHRGRNCIYDEARAVIEVNKDTLNTVYDQMAKYLKEGYPYDNGMIQTGLLIRRRCKLLDEFSNMWWNEVKNHSHRDQLSFNYCAWKTGLTYEIIHYSTFQSCFKLHAHK